MKLSFYVNGNPSGWQIDESHALASSLIDACKNIDGDCWPGTTETADYCGVPFVPVVYDTDARAWVPPDV